MTPQQKIQLMRQAEINPGLALLTMLEFLRKEAKTIVSDELANKDTIDYLKKELNRGELPPEIVAKIKAVKGEKGDKGDAGNTLDENAISHKVFQALLPLVPKAPEPIMPTVPELLSIIKPLIPKAEHGKTPTQQELVSLIKPLIPESEIKDEQAEEDKIVAIVKSLLPEYKDISIDDIISKVLIKVNDQPIPASRITGLPKYKKGRLHGGGDTIVAGSSITIVRNSDGTVTISSTAGGATYVENEVVSGSGTTFTLANTPVALSVHIFIRGQRAKLTTDYSISGTTITTVDTLIAGDVVADYRK